MYVGMGEKGTGKTSMLVHAMRHIYGRGVIMLDAHCDISVFRLRLGRALDFAYSEDYRGGWLTTRELREGTSLLDIERAMNSLEKVAIRHRETHGRPLVLVINDIHHIQDDTEDARRLLTLLQQRAESWAAGELVTVVFTRDEYRMSDSLKLHAARMNIAAMTIAQALVKQEKDQKNPNSELPGIPLHEAQQLMTRADLPQKLN
ncbi:AAA ATPase domain protein [Aspergillus parasiticus SU-1]|uniref:AAA ATPase domain protein n=1 Tax=Aspergillus parasiticus (strain ATCC 56775 / NRRL 5862 / SRRC 143 / SU-1) TaxID=1403190 RepID=A0A0F0HZR7_ASPPU|nr:AAA ATPase domain protein [Aspergillus parasiticus SU-1]